MSPSPEWKRACQSYSCVEVLLDHNTQMVLVRDTKDADVPRGERIVLQFSGRNWMKGMIPRIKDRGMDWRLRDEKDNYVMYGLSIVHGGGMTLAFTRQEWADFLSGCKKGDFDLKVPNGE